jgi:hypothetical protein
MLIAWILAWWMVRGIVRLVMAIADDLLVLCRLKWYPPTGRARWRWSR